MSRNIIFVLISIASIILGCSSPVVNSKDLSWTDGKIVFWSFPEYATLSAFIMKEDGSQIAHLEGTNQASGLPIAWSPDGQRIAFAGYVDEVETTCIILMSANESQCVIVGGYAPSWSPDGQYIVFYSYATGTNPAGLFIFDLQSGLTRELTALPHSNSNKDVISSWSPDGSQIVYGVSDEQDIESLWIIPTGGGEAHRLTTGRFPVWSPQGNEIAYVDESGIWVYDLERDEATLFIDDASALWPTWSPDGSELLFSAKSGEKNYYAFEKNRDEKGLINRRVKEYYSIFRISRDGNDLVNLTQDQSVYLAPSWRPGGD